MVCSEFKEDENQDTYPHMCRDIKRLEWLAHGMSGVKPMKVLQGMVRVGHDRRKRSK